MGEDCIFCKIVQGEIPCAKVYETDAVLAFLDIAPVNKGHTLIVPKSHYSTLFDVPPEFGHDLLLAMRTVGKVLMDVTGATGLNMGMNNFRTAGQLVFHAHWHLIPRFDGDGLTLWEQKAYDDKDEINRLARAVREHIA